MELGSDVEDCCAASVSEAGMYITVDHAGSIHEVKVMSLSICVSIFELKLILYNSFIFINELHKVVGFSNGIINALD